MRRNRPSAFTPRLEYAENEATFNRFRAMTSTLLDESRRTHSGAIERQFVHVEKNAVRNADAHGEHASNERI